MEVQFYYVQLFSTHIFCMKYDLLWSLGTNLLSATNLFVLNLYVTNLFFTNVFSANINNLVLNKCFY